MNFLVSMFVFFFTRLKNPLYTRVKIGNNYFVVFLLLSFEKSGLNRKSSNRILRKEEKKPRARTIKIVNENKI